MVLDGTCEEPSMHIEDAYKSGPINEQWDGGDEIFQAHTNLFDGESDIPLHRQFERGGRLSHLHLVATKPGHPQRRRHIPIMDFLVQLLHCTIIWHSSTKNLIMDNTQTA